MENEAICTIIAKNYTASARVLAASFLGVPSGRKCYVLIVDDFAGYVDPREEMFNIVTLHELEIPNVDSLCFQYDIQELCTAVKAALLNYLIRKKSLARVIYLDPDILVTGSLDGLFEKLRQHDVVLTPHLDHDYPDDGLMPNDGYILRAGVFNLGFIGVNSSRNALSFLDWWNSKLYTHCIVDLLNGYFVDQKFIDLVPLFFENVHIEKSVGYNVAYWNLHSRKITRESETWMCNDGPLYFFHFSGYSPHNTRISKHIGNQYSRIQLSSREDLRGIFQEYKNQLLRHGYDVARSWPYQFAYFDTGEPISRKIRVWYRTASNRTKYGNPFASKRIRWLSGLQRMHKQLAEGIDLEEEIDFSIAPSKGVLTPEEQLEAILRSRAWKWVCRYGRFKKRLVIPIVKAMNHVTRRVNMA